MTFRTVCNTTDFTSKKHCHSETLENQRDNTGKLENSPNNVNNTGDPLIYKAREHRPCGTLQDGNVAPLYNGPIDDIVLTQNVLMAPIDFSTYFTGGVTYTLTVTPSGCSFDTDTGILSGTPDTVSSYNPIVSAINPGGTTDSEAMNLDVTA